MYEPTKPEDLEPYGDPDPGFADPILVYTLTALFVIFTIILIVCLFVYFQYLKKKQMSHKKYVR